MLSFQFNPVVVQPVPEVPTSRLLIFGSMLCLGGFRQWSRAKAASRRGRFAVLAIFLAGLLSVSTARADLISNTLGTAGPSHWAILTLTGSQDIALNGPGTTFGNVGISSAGNLQLNASNNGPVSNTAIDGNLFLGNTATVNNTAQVSGSVLTNQDALLNQANTDAVNAAATFSALSPTLSVPANAITGATTVNGTPGVNVLDITNINLGGGHNLTLNGPAGSEFVINDSGGFTLNSSQIDLTGGVTANDVVLNVTSTGMNLQTSGGLNNESVINGILLTHNDSIGFAPGLINGELIAGGREVHLVSGASVNQVPEPSSLAFLALGAGGMLTLRRRRKAASKKIARQ